MQSRVDRHRDHHLRQVVAVVLGLAQPTSLAARIVKSTSSSRYGATQGLGKVAFHLVRSSLTGIVKLSEVGAVANHISLMRHI